MWLTCAQLEDRAVFKEQKERESPGFSRPQGLVVVHFRVMCVLTWPLGDLFSS